MSDCSYNCTICFYPYNEKNRVCRILQCGHSYCHECLSQLFQSVSSWKFKCPTCRKINTARTISELVRNFLVEHMAIKLKDLNNNLTKYKTLIDAGEKDNNLDPSYYPTVALVSKLYNEMSLLQERINVIENNVQMHVQNEKEKCIENERLTIIKNSRAKVSLKIMIYLRINSMLFYYADLLFVEYDHYSSWCSHPVFLVCSIDLTR